MNLSYHSRHAASAERLRKRNKREGYTMDGKKIWTREEDDIVRFLFPDYQAMAKALPQRSYSGFRYRAKVMGLVQTRPQFTAREL